MPYFHCTERLNLYYIDVNSQGAETVLLLHGLGATSDSWVFQLPVLVENGYRIIAFDARGFGRSTYPGGGNRIAWMAEDALKLLNWLKVDRFHTVGISMGGTIALQMALTYPERIDKLVLINTFASLRPHSPDVWLYFIVRLLMVHLLGLQVQARFVAKRIFQKPEDVNLRTLLEGQINQANIHAYRAAMRSIAMFNVVGRLAEIRLPTLIISGQYDTTVPLKNQALLAHGIKNSVHKVIPGAGHAATIEKSGEINQMLIDFLA